MSVIRTFFALGLLLAHVLFVTAYAIHFPKPPKNNNFYVDAGNLIQPNIRNEINQIANKLWQERKIPFFVVTIPSLITQGAIHYTIKDYANALFNFWGIGSRDKSYGILLLISKAEHMASIILGSGWGNTFDMKKKTIVKEIVIANFDRDQFSDELLKGVINLNLMTIGINIPKQSQLVNKETTKPVNEPFSYPLLKLTIACIMILIVITMLNSNQRKQKLLRVKKDEEDKKSEI